MGKRQTAVAAATHTRTVQGGGRQTRYTRIDDDDERAAPAPLSLYRYVFWPEFYAAATQPQPTRPLADNK